MVEPPPRPSPPASPPARAARVLSIDVLRGLDVLLMLFVNEMAGVAGTPAWLRHVPAGADGMTITDVVFPAFLFVTGMAIPLALGDRLRRGQPATAIWRHVLTRSLALVVIGVFMVNAEHGSAPPPFSPDLWNVLMTIAVVLVWQAPARNGSRHWGKALLTVGVVGLVVAALTYRSASVSGILQLRPQWWGILGLIGWAYLVAASTYLLVGNRAGVLAIASIALYGVYFADVFVGVPWLVAARPYLRVGPVLGSHAALVLSGTVLATFLLRRDAEARGRVLRDALIYSTVLLAAGLALHQFRDVHRAFWINKPLATPAWCLVSAAITAAAWAALHYFVDIRQWRRWPPSVTAAGENALLAYLLAPLLLSLLALTAPLTGGVNLYAALGGVTIVGWVRSIVFAWVVARLCGSLRAAGLRLQI